MKFCIAIKFQVIEPVRADRVKLAKSVGVRHRPIDRQSPSESAHLILGFQIRGNPPQPLTTELQFLYFPNEVAHALLESRSIYNQLTDHAHQIVKAIQWHTHHFTRFTYA